MLKAGARVVLNGRNSEALDRTAAALTAGEGEIMKIVADVSESDAFSAAVDQIIDRYGKLDVLILNAGLSSYGSVEQTSDQSLERVMQVNTFGPYSAARIALPHIRKTGGSIVFISSLAGLHGLPFGSVYSMSKMALTALAQSLKTELTGQGIHIGIIYVGFTRNEPDKTAIAPDGSVKPLQERPGWMQQSTAKVARKIVRNVRRRKYRSVLSAMGILMAFMVRFFPRLFHFGLRGMLKQAAKMTAED